MYCPVCFNHTLKIAPRGVVKVAINGKSKPTSQFIFNIKTEKQAEIDKKFKAVLSEYFNWYKTLTNIEEIKNIDITSCDFICEEGCRLTFNHMLNVIDYVIPKDRFHFICQEAATEHSIPINLKR